MGTFPPSSGPPASGADPRDRLAWAAVQVDRAAVDADLAGISAQLHGVCRAVAAHLDLAGAAIRLSVTGADGVAASSDGRARVLAELQFDANEGPGHQAVAAHRPVLVPDLQAAALRWPGFAILAADHSLEAIFSFPLQEGAVFFGILELYDGRPRGLSDDDLSVVAAFARVATLRLLDERAVGTGTLEPGVSRALERAVVYQAQGMVMVDLGVPLREALARMRGRAFAEGVSVDELARRIVGDGSWPDGGDGEGPTTGSGV
jgi:GAF domain/ANTAR domain